MGLIKSFGEVGDGCEGLDHNQGRKKGPYGINGSIRIIRHGNNLKP